MGAFPSVSAAEGRDHLFAKLATHCLQELTSRVPLSTWRPRKPDVRRVWHAFYFHGTFSPRCHYRWR